MTKTEILKVPKTDFFSVNSDAKSLEPNRKYKVTTEAAFKKGFQYSSYFVVILQDNENREITRHIRWLNDYTERPIQYSIIFTAPSTRALSCGEYDLAGLMTQP